MTVIHTAMAGVGKDPGTWEGDCNCGWRVVCASLNVAAQAANSHMEATREDGE